MTRVTLLWLGFLILLAAFYLASCQSKQDRQWRDLQTVLEITQGARP